MFSLNNVQRIAIVRQAKGFFPNSAYHLTTEDAWMIKETGIHRQVLLWGDSLCNQKFMDFLRYRFMCAVVFSSQKGGPILHEFAESLSNPFRYL